METYLFWIVPIASLLALVLAWYFYKQMMRESEGTPTMEKIALYVRQRSFPSCIFLHSFC